jgi:hypothetical protein
MEQFSGVVRIEDDAGHAAIVLDGPNKSVKVGVKHGESVESDVPSIEVPTSALATSGESPSFVVYRVALDGATGTITVNTEDGVPLATIGGADSGGQVSLRDASGRVTLELHAETAVLRVGEEEQAGQVAVHDRKGREVVHLGGRDAEVRVGARDHDGSVVVVDGSTGLEALQFDADDGALKVGTSGTGGAVVVRNDNGDDTILLDGEEGDIVLSNADAAEEFTLAGAAEPTPGAVMVLTDDGAVRPCTDAYDERVVGAVAGAGAYRPAIVLDRRPRGAGRRVPISMLGKVTCKADAAHASIGVGDLLTTSPSPGCAMRVVDRGRALGAVLGKALTPLAAGEGLVDVLVGLR